jgi:hypothetical protein
MPQEDQKKPCGAHARHPESGSKAEHEADAHQVKKMFN